MCAGLSHNSQRRVQWMRAATIQCAEAYSQDRSTTSFVFKIKILKEVTTRVLINSPLGEISGCVIARVPTKYERRLPRPTCANAKISGEKGLVSIYGHVHVATKT